MKLLIDQPLPEARVKADAEEGGGAGLGPVWEEVEAVLAARRAAERARVPPPFPAPDAGPALGTPPRARWNLD